MLNKPTHQVTIVISSQDDDPTVNLKVHWDPLLADNEAYEMGFVPAAYKTAEHLLFAIEGLIDNDQLLEIEEGDLDACRSIN